MVDLCSLAKHSFVFEFFDLWLCIIYSLVEKKGRNWAVEKMLSKNLATTYRYRLQENVPACRFLQRPSTASCCGFLNQLTGCHSRANMKT